MLLAYKIALGIHFKYFSHFNETLFLEVIVPGLSIEEEWSGNERNSRSRFTAWPVNVMIEGIRIPRDVLRPP